MRPGASGVLVMLATLLLLLSIIANWARAEVYDRERFTDHAADALGEGAVRDALVDAIVAEIILAGPSQAISIRPLVELVTETVVDSRAFVRIYRDAIGDLHSSLFADRSDDETIALTLVDAMIVISALIEQAYPEVADQLPADLTSTFVELRDRDWAVQLVGFGPRVGYLAFLFPLASLALYAAAVFISADRRRVMVYIGTGCMAIGILLATGRNVAREFVLGRVPFNDRAVVEAIWDVYTESLMGWALLAGGVGLAITIAGSGVEQRVNPGEHYARVRAALAYTPTATWARATRAGIFLFAGFVAIRERDQVLDLILLAAGAYVIYYAVSELVWLAVQRARPSSRPEPAPGPAPAWLLLRGGIALTLFLFAAASTYFVYDAFQAGGAAVVADVEVRECNGHEELCDRRLDEVVFLGSHNAMSAASEPGWFYAEQISGITGQLEYGARALLIDTWYGYGSTRGVRTEGRDFAIARLDPDIYGPEVVEAARRLAASIGPVNPDAVPGTYLCHAYCELGATPLVEALSDIRRFMLENPGEVIILFIQDQISPSDTAKAFIASELSQLVYTPAPGAPLPTLRELIERDERVIVFAENDAEGIDWYLPGFDYVQETPFSARSIAELTCDPERGESANPLFQLNHWISRSSPTVNDARVVNNRQFLLGRIAECEQARGQRVNLVNLNFVEIGDGLAVVDELNGVAEDIETDAETAG